jgi:hypothetical protein
LHKQQLFLSSVNNLFFFDFVGVTRVSEGQPIDASFVGVTMFLVGDFDLVIVGVGVVGVGFVVIVGVGVVGVEGVEGVVCFVAYRRRRFSHSSPLFEADIVSLICCVSSIR